MKIGSRFVLLSLSLAACGGSSSNVPASVSGATPNSAFVGRTVDVTLSGSGTNWTASTTASFGDDVKVNTLTVASPSALVANITVANNAKLGARDITVTDDKNSEPYKMAFTVTDAVSVTTQGTAQQGSVVFFTIKNMDLTHLFDTTSTGDGFTSPIVYTNINVTTPDTMAFTPSTVTPFEIDGTLLIDADAAAGGFDLDIQSGPSTGTTDEFFYPAVITIAAQTPTALTDGAKVTLDQPYASKLFTYTPQAAGNLIALSTSGGTMASPGIVVLDKSGSFNNIIGNGSAFSYLPTSKDEIFVMVWDAGGTGSDTATVALQDLTLTVQAGGEGDDTVNNVATTPTVLSAPPVIVKSAKLSSATDVDFYEVAVPAGKAIHVRTLDGDPGVDTAVSFFASDGVTALGDADAMDGVVDNNVNDLGEDTITNVVPAAGNYLIEILAGASYDATLPTYNLVVTLE